MAAYSGALNGWNYLAVTKLDVLDGLKKVTICTGYKLQGKVIDYFPSEAEELALVEPVYEDMPGWGGRWRVKRALMNYPKRHRIILDA